MVNAPVRTSDHVMIRATLLVRSPHGRPRTEIKSATRSATRPVSRSGFPRERGRHRAEETTAATLTTAKPADADSSIVRCRCSKAGPRCEYTIGSSPFRTRAYDLGAPSPFRSADDLEYSAPARKSDQVRTRAAALATSGMRTK